jgi:predicted  nucleic acid-binding Zn-ribbon protein
MALTDDALPQPDLPRDPLLRLQDLDLSVDRLNARLGELESGEDLRRARTALAEAQTTRADLTLSIEDVARDQGRLEHDIDSMQRKIDAEERRLFDGSVVNARELQSIRAEVDNLRARRTRIEDELIERMERREELEGHVPPVEAAVAEAAARVAEIEQTSARDVVGIEGALRERSAERDALVPEIDPEVLALYEDLRRQKKGIGAAALVDGVCQACHQKLSAVYVSKLRASTGVRRCEYCRRILVLA